MNPRLLVGGLFGASAGLVLLSAAAGPAAVTAPARAVAIVALANPRGLAADRAGNLYVGDVDAGSVQKISPSGAVSLLGSTIKDPIGLALGPDGALYVADADDNAVYRLVVGAPPVALGSAAGGATFSTPAAVAVNAAGEVFVANNGNNCILRVDRAGGVSVFAGKAGSAGSADGPGSAARFTTPRGLAIDAAGNVYVADEGNSNIRKITPAGVVSTLAGQADQSGSADGRGAAARFAGPRALAVDAAGSIFVADTDNHTIRKITADGAVSTLAGRAGEAGAADGAAAAARFSEPRGIAVDAVGNVYVADTGNGAIRQITPAGEVFTLTAAGKP